MSAVAVPCATANEPRPASSAFGSVGAAGCSGSSHGRGRPQMKPAPAGQGSTACGVLSREGLPLAFETGRDASNVNAPPAANSVAPRAAE
eukprot:4524522-Prymnesium_polylepis.1